jgi:hypothetical protein
MTGRARGFRASRFLFGLLIRRFRLRGEPKPIFSDQKPRVHIFGYPSLRSLI